jgi:hypothetical protein
MTKALMMDEKDARQLYPSASPEWKKALEVSFGKETFSQKITDRVKTFADACEVLDIDPDDVVHSADDTDDQAYKKLKVIVRALNEGWEPNYDESNQRKWYPWFYLNEPGFRLYVVIYSYSATIVGARLVYRTRALAEYAAKQFKTLYREMME